MFWKRKKEGTVFSKYYKELLKIANSSPLSNNAEYELLPAMYVVCDYAVASAGKDRVKIADELIEQIDKIHHGFNRSSFDKRCALYAMIIQGKALRCEWWASEDNHVFYTNAMTKCAALLCDILYNPECADNYDTAPIRLGSAFENMNFIGSVVMPMVDKFVELFKSIYDV